MKAIAHPAQRGLVKVRAVKVLSNFCVHLAFTDGTEKDIDLEPLLRGPIFEPIRNDPRMFASVFIDPIGRTLAWPNEADIAPETLYGESELLWAQPEINPRAKAKTRGRKRVKGRAHPARGHARVRG